MKYNIKLTLKAIIRAEQLLGKPFNDIDYTSEADVLALLYCAVLANNKERFTFEAFKIIVQNDNQYKAILSAFEDETKIIAQFNRMDSRPGDDTPEKGAKQYISDLAGTLIMSGVSAEYILNEAELSDLLFLVKAYDTMRRERMERERMWTFYSILPHINSKKIKDPSDMIAFPWEREKKRAEGEALIEAQRDEFQRFMSGEYNYLMK
jgi:hypothetical protein